MQYRQNSFTSSLFQTGIGLEQGSSLSPILLALYLVPILKIWEKRSKNLTIPISISTLSFVDNGLFISQEKNFKKMNTTLFTCFNMLSSILQNFGLAIKHNKTKVFHFTQATKNADPLPLNLFLLGGPVLRPKHIWQYLGFYFDKKLTFRYYTYFYSNRAIFTVKSIKMLGNSNYSLLHIQKCLLYRTCILPIAIYSFQLQYFKGAPTHYPLKNLKKMQ